MPKYGSDTFRTKISSSNKAISPVYRASRSEVHVFNGVRDADLTPRFQLQATSALKKAYQAYPLKQLESARLVNFMTAKTAYPILLLLQRFIATRIILQVGREVNCKLLRIRH